MTSSLQLATLRWGDFADPALPLLVLGPGLGTTSLRLWGDVADRLSTAFRVLAWDLPGHGDSVPCGIYSIADLAASVLRSVDSVGGGDGTAPFHYGGDSIGGTVGIQLLLDAPERITSATLLCTGPVMGTPQGWFERADAVRRDGTAVLLDDTPARWFSAEFVAGSSAVVQGFLADLAAVDDLSYAAACEALAGFDVRNRLVEITTPVLAAAGGVDAATPATALRHLASGVQTGSFVEIAGVGHLPPAEDSAAVAKLILANTAVTPGARDALRARGMQVRREVLGDAHVDTALESTNEFTRDFQQLITRYAWGEIWTRPGLDRRSRSLVTLTALVARGHHDELAMHLRAALTNGVTRAEIKELLMQTAIYCGVPEANTAFRIAQDVLRDAGNLETRPEDIE